MKIKSHHPTAAQMVKSALKTIKSGRNGVSFQAIRKYIMANYLVDYERYAHHVKKYLKSSVDAGTLIQIRGKGASGSFKLNRLNLGEKRKNSKKSLKSVKHSRVLKVKRLNKKSKFPRKDQDDRSQSFHSYHSLQKSVSSYE